MTQEQYNMVMEFETWWEAEGETDQLANQMEDSLKMYLEDPMDQLVQLMKNQRFYDSKYKRPRVNNKRKRVTPMRVPPGFEKQLGLKK